MYPYKGTLLQQSLTLQQYGAQHGSRNVEAHNDSQERRRLLQHHRSEDVCPSRSLTRFFLMIYRWITSAQVATKMILLARTTPLEEVKKPSEGLSLFFIDSDRTKPGLDMRKIRKMGGRAVDANEVFFDNYRIPADTLIGKEGQGFKIVSTIYQKTIQEAEFNRCCMV